MKNLVTKYWALLGSLISVAIDVNTGLVVKLVGDPFWQKMVYLFGTVIYGYFFTSKYNAYKAKRR